MSGGKKAMASSLYNILVFIVVHTGACRVDADKASELAAPLPGCAVPPGSVRLDRCHLPRLSPENGCFSATRRILAACTLMNTQVS